MEGVPIDPLPAGVLGGPAVPIPQVTHADREARKPDGQAAGGGREGHRHRPFTDALVPGPFFHSGGDEIF